MRGFRFFTARSWNQRRLPFVYMMRALRIG